MTTTKTMESDENFKYDKVVETEDEEDHIHPDPTPDNPDDGLSHTIYPSPHDSPRKKKPIVVPLT